MNPELLTALDEAKAARAAAWKARRDFHKSPEGRFTRSMKAAMNEYLKMRAEDVSRDDAVRGVEEVLRATWPFRTREAHTCDSCDDTGWRRTLCQHHVRCGRLKPCAYADPDWEHFYVVPCECAAGDRFRPQQRTAEDALASVGRSKKPVKKGWRTLAE